MSKIKPLKKLDLEVINKLLRDGYIKTNVHPSGDLTIYNYTEKCMFDKFWTPETIQCRGLISDKEGNIVSRPFPKFFNLGENGQVLPDEPFDVYEKLDGSLGISYFYDGKTHIATRGSFTSPQAIYATKMLREIEKSVGPCIPPDLTYLFEIIYPENRIVVNYGDRRSLVLLSVIDISDGFEAPARMFDVNGWDIVQEYDGIKDIETLKKLNEKNKEGFVLHYPKSRFRVKIKFDDYVRIHSIVTQMTKRKVWEMVKDGKSFYELIKQIPDELFGWIKDTESSLKSEYQQIETEARVSLDEIMQNFVHANRKSIALIIVKCKYSHIMFRMLDNKNYSECIWKLLEPKHEVPVIDGLQFYNEN